MMQELLASTPSWLNFLIFLGLGGALLAVILGFVSYAILAERKVIGFMQMRLGPNQLGGRLGLLQTVADVLKLLIKEDTIPNKADKPLFILAPVIAFVPAFMVIAALPFTDRFHFADLGVGLLYYLAISGITVIGVITGGWASNNKYALLGGLRGAAQMISYEIPLVMSVVGVVLLSGSLNLIDIVEAQSNVWFVILQPLAFIIFLVSAIAELNRVPFDLPEAESELVAGYFIEYSGFRFAFFMLAEYVYIFAMACLITILFFGGWLPPFQFLDFIPGIVWFVLKFSLFVFFVIWLRTTFLRLRSDHLMEFAWKVLLPLALFNIFITAIVRDIFLR